MWNPSETTDCRNAARFSSMYSIGDSDSRLWKGSVEDSSSPGVVVVRDVSVSIPYVIFYKKQLKLMYTVKANLH